MNIHPLVYTLILVLTINFTDGQHRIEDSLTVYEENYTKISYKSLVIPAVLITSGIFAMENYELKSMNNQIKKQEFFYGSNEKTRFDDFLQYAPSLSVYGLNLAGIEGQHQFKDRTIILATSSILMGGSIYFLKSIIREERPDASRKNSFPSGHTGTAFMGAEFLMQEYKHESVWYGISGYLVAAGTGYLRMHHNRHWFSDILAGAGIGILSVKVAYWIYPVFNRWLFKFSKHGTENIITEELNFKTLALPFYNGKQIGLSMAITF